MLYLFRDILKNWKLLSILLFAAACQSESENTLQPTNKFHDDVLVKIYDYQDKRQTDSLLQYFDHENAAYRRAAAEAFGSVQDSLAIPYLTLLLNDQNAKVRKAAAYALGQSYDSSTVEPLLIAYQAEDSLFVKREIIESLGKVITQPLLSRFNRIKTVSDLEKEGLAWGLYRAGIRNVHDDLSVGTAIVLLAASNNYQTRLGAAHFLYRTPNIEIKNYLPQLIRAATSDSAANVRMAVTSALGKVQTPSAVRALAQQCLKDSDYRVRINAIRALSVAANFDMIRDDIYQSLEDANINVAIEAARLIRQHGENEDFLAVRALKHEDHRVTAILLGAALKAATNKNDYSQHIKLEYNKATSPFYKAALLNALQHHLPNYDFIVTQVFLADNPIITTSGAQALVAMRAREPFPKELEPAFAEVFKEMMLTEDPGIVAVTSELLADTTYNFRESYDSYDFLYQLRDKFSLPQHFETLQKLIPVIALFEGKEQVEMPVNPYNHPIDWEQVKKIPVDQRIRMVTSRGEIMLKLLVEEAPGSVVNFIKLTNEGYFDGLQLHRVVPNFVIQDGCNRGDGYGGKDYSIRSEFANMRYETGTVGMASAGKDTEGTQWFITHSPTPHLDGKYSIFARVESGMNVIHNAEVGDVIEKIELIENSNQ